MFKLSRRLLLKAKKTRNRRRHPSQLEKGAFVDLLKDVGSGFLANLNDEADTNFASLLEGEDKKKWTKELLKTKLLQKRLKRRRLED